MARRQGPMTPVRQAQMAIIKRRFGKGSRPATPQPAKEQYCNRCEVFIGIKPYGGLCNDCYDHVR